MLLPLYNEIRNDLYYYYFKFTDFGNINLFIIVKFSYIITSFFILLLAFYYIYFDLNWRAQCNLKQKTI